MAVKYLRTELYPLDQLTHTQIHHESQIYATLNHQNITRLITPTTIGILYKYHQNIMYEVQYLVLEYINGAELFDIISFTEPFSNNTARYFFHKFMEGLLYLHTNGLVHRDIKVENLMIDINGVLKFIDFGFTAQIQGPHNNGLLNDLVGTRNYLAPELWQGGQYEGTKVDIFCAGIVLFIMLSGHPPFNSANPNKDIYYKAFANKGPAAYWNVIQSKYHVNPGFASEEFKNLINMMIACDPSDRPTLQDIMKNKWYLGPIPSDEEIKQEINNRLAILRERRQKEENEQMQMGFHLHLDNDQDLGIGETHVPELDNKLIREFIEIPGKFTYKALRMDPKLILLKIMDYVDQRQGNFLIHSKYMKVSFDYMINDETLQFIAEVRKGENLNYIYLNRVRGHPYNFNNEYKEIIKIFN